MKMYSLKNAEKFLREKLKKGINKQDYRGWELKELQRKKCKSFKNIESIVIDSELVNVNIFVAETSKIRAHFYGKSNVECDANLKITRIDKELRIVLNFSGNFYMIDSKLDIILPKKIFKKIYIKSDISNVIVNKDVLVESVEFCTVTGNFESYALASKVSASTKSGNVKIDINLTKDIEIKAYTINGNINVKLKNIRIVNLTRSVMTEKIKEFYAEKGQYSATVNVSTMTGNIVIE